ncbi:MAG: DUF4114 domain-containing protein [Gemmataceae bacterium]
MAILPRRLSRNMRLESLEAREVPATGITLDNATGILTIEGSTTNDLAQVDYALVQGTNGAVADTSKLVATIQTDFGYQTQLQFTSSQVKLIQFLGKTGSDLFDNNTALPSTTTSWTGGAINTSLLLGSPGNTSTTQDGEVGVFTVGATGKVEVDYLYKGAGYRGELGFFSLKGMESLKPGSEEFIKEAARRALSESDLGYVVIKAQSEGARFSSNLPWEGDLNSGKYRGPKEFTMAPGDRFAAILVPNGRVHDVYKDPSIGGDKRPLFSLPEANPYVVTSQLRAQVGDLDGHGSVFAFEDLRLDGSSDRDYNDMVFQVVGAFGVAAPVADSVNPTRNFLNTAINKEIAVYTQERSANNTSTVAEAGQAGTFRVANDGKIGVDYLFDGGGYVGELAMFSLQGMQNLTPGSPEFIKEATRRAISDSVLGHVIISDRVQGARSSDKVTWEANFNQGTYLGVEKFTMTPGDTVAFMLVPNGMVWEIYNKPTITGNKRPLFSLAKANPMGPTGSTQLADITGQGTTFGFEDQRQDGVSDRDYNDMVFRVSGLQGWAESLASVVNTAKNILNQEAASRILA